MADPSASYWFEEIPAQNRFPVFTGSLEVDIAIVGSGIAGLTAAYFLSKSGLRVALLEQGFIGGGDSGYTTAFISHFLDNAEDTKRTWAASEEALEIIARVVKEEKINCDFRRIDALAFTKGDPNTLKTDYRFLLSADSSMRFLGKKEASGFAGFGVESAILIKNQAEFHPRQYLLALAKFVHSEGCELFEESQALEIIDGGKTILLERGSIKTLATVIASGRPPAGFEEVSKLLSPYLTFVISADLGAPGPLGDYLFWDDDIPYHYFRWVNDRELIVGGEDRPLNTVRANLSYHNGLEKFLRTILPTEFKVTRKWQGMIFTTLDSLPYIGRHPTYGENVYFACGFGGNGMTFGTLAGKVISDAVMGRENKFAKQFSFVRL